MEGKNDSVDITRCLALIQSAQSDNERLASLLIVAKLLKSHDLDCQTRKKIFDTIGFTFINRLIITRSDDSELFQQVGVAILSSFCTDEELVVHPQVTSKIPHFNDFITSSSLSTSIIEDSLHCLQSLVIVDKGREHLWKFNSLYSLCQCFIIHEKYQVPSKSIILHLLSDKDQLTNNIVAIVTSLQYIGEQFKTIENEIKFELCQLLTDILNYCGELLCEVSLQQSWLPMVGIGLRDILQSRLDVSHRNITLILLGLICQLYGCQWMISIPPRDTKDKQCSFFLLAVHLVCVEVQLMLDNHSIADHVVLISCFSVMESAIVLMANSSDKMKDSSTLEVQSEFELITEENLLQLHTTLMEGLLSVVKFLKTLSQEPPHGKSDEQLELQSNPLLTPAVRLVGAWLAEDSLSLTSEVYSLIPYLLRQCDDGEEGDELIKFLLPGFGHLVTEEKMYKILLENGLVRILLRYTNSLIKRLSNDVVLSQLSVCLSVMLPLCINQNTLNSLDWLEWTSPLTTIVSSQPCPEHELLVIYSITLYIMILRKHQEWQYTSSVNKILNQVVGILTSCVSRMTDHGSHDTRNEIFELCFIALQELTVLASRSVDIKNALINFPILSSISQLLKQLLQREVTTQDQQTLISCLDKLMKTLNK